MDWIELAVKVRAPDVEAVADVLRQHAGGVAVQEEIEVLDEAQGYRVREEAPVLLRAYLPVSDGSSERVWAVRDQLNALPAGAPPEIVVRRVQEQDWADAWKEHFHVEHAGRRVVIRPTWREYAPAPGEVVIDLDPGMAFGTGQHPTTRMCLEALERWVRPGARVLDVGTGSGILAIAAAKLGAAHVLAMDIEQVAVEAAQGNVRANGVDDRVAVFAGTLGDGWPPDMPPAEGADLVVANINAAAIVDLAPFLAGVLRQGGVLIASGIVAGREDDVTGRLEAEGLTVMGCDVDGDWRTVTASRGPAG